MSAPGKEALPGGGEVSEQTCLLMKAELSLFPYLSEEDLGDLPCYFRHLKVKSGEEIFREGDPCEFLGYIIEGSIEIKKETEFQGKAFVLGIYGAGSIVGESCILDAAPRAVTAVAREDTTLVVLSRENLERMLDESPAVGAKFLKGLLLAVSIRLRKSFDRMAAIF